MPIKDLVVSIDPSRPGQQRLELAFRLARRFTAHLVGYYVAPTVGEYATAGRTTTAAEDVADSMEQQFEQDLKRYGLEGRWLLSGEPVVEDIVGEIRTADLAVLGLGNPDPSVSDAQGFRPDDVIVACGRPVLALPIANLPPEIGRNVLLAWDGSRGAGRAMNDALPLLADGASVTVVSVEPDEPARQSAQSAAAHLRRHGVAAEAREIARAGMAIGDVVLAYCEHLRADLVVAGAFGHSRLRESIVGGVSRTLLHQMMVPVLMSH
jgi:nucleotide-binding universal stress UspA family protein